ncbi:MAG: radical SAM protein [Thermoanaerobaculales bacterium]|jgi:wyosine [tRNA(Phe)-imidazoG37] synthetase (radical SAM superfamily)|nr:radical SAM protein [Thermoanaerobaculales bacterium]
MKDARESEAGEAAISPTMQHVFGPVPSRRLGMSLGIDPVPLKTCNHSCVYCQLGRTRRLARERAPFFDVADILCEVAHVVEGPKGGGIDWITFVGSGETTLASNLGLMIRGVKTMSDLPVAVITNGSLLHLADVRDELQAADAVLPSLDAGSAGLYRKINRPPRELGFEDHVRGLVEFRRAYRGELWVEVMLLGGVNDTEAALQDLAAVLQRVAPDEIHLATPTRPPAEPSVVPPGPDGLDRAAAVLGRVARVLRPVHVDGTMTAGEDAVAAVQAIISRHPLEESEIKGLLTRWVPGRVEEAWAELTEREEIRSVDRFGKRFWCAGDMEFPRQDRTAGR